MSPASIDPVCPHCGGTGGHLRHNHSTGAMWWESCRCAERPTAPAKPLPSTHRPDTAVGLYDDEDPKVAALEKALTEEIAKRVKAEAESAQLAAHVEFLRKLLVRERGGAR